MKRLSIPHSLATQLLCLLIAGLLAVHLLAAQLGGKTVGSMHKIGRDQIIERYAAAYRVMSTCNEGCPRSQLLAGLSARDARFAIVANPPKTGMNDEEVAISALVGQSLGRGVSPEIHVQLQRLPQTDTDPAVKVRMQISTRLHDARWLTADLRPTVRHSWWWTNGYAFAISFLPVLIIVLLFTRYLLHPLSGLVRAAERISHGETPEPVIQGGPRELREVIAVFNSMQEKITRLITCRTRMAAAISHDLRTPITSLCLRTELVDDPNLRTAMLRTLDDMQQMVEETLRYFRNDELQELPTEIDLAELVARIGQEHQMLGRNVTWQCPPELIYRCKVMALSRSLNNLIDNAVRHGLRARLSLQAGKEITLIVDDDGPGMAPERLAAIFESLTPTALQAPNSGSGARFGLAIAHAGIVGQGGELTLSNRSEGGLRACIKLPV